LDSVDAGWWSRLEMGAIPLVNEATGRIGVGLGTGGSRVIAGSVRNRGAWSVESGVALEVNPGVLGFLEHWGGAIESMENRVALGGAGAL
jgi:hypothetical protein